MAANNVIKNIINYPWGGDWATSTAYAKNELVRNSSATIPGSYVCLIAHTSGTFATDLAAGKWGLYVADGTNTISHLSRAYLSSAQDNLTDATDIKVLLNAESWDVGADFDTTNKRFVAPHTGYYSVKGSVGFSGVIADKTYQVMIWVNGAAVTFTMLSSSNTGSLRIPISDDVYAVAGQYIELYARVTAGANTVDLIAASTSTYMSITHIPT